MTYLTATRMTWLDVAFLEVVLVAVIVAASFAAGVMWNRYRAPRRIDVDGSWSASPTSDWITWTPAKRVHARKGDLLVVPFPTDDEAAAIDEAINARISAKERL